VRAAAAEPSYNLWGPVVGPAVSRNWRTIATMPSRSRSTASHGRGRRSAKPAK